jgi:hypothetical protein
MLDECECDERPVPRWVVLNEVWRSVWLTDNDYREWVVGVVRHLSQKHERKVLLAVPFKFPDEQTINPWWWKKLQEYAYLGIEGYISGERALAMGNTIAALRAEYQEMKDSYAKVGVRPERMILLEHFGQTTKGTDFGRAGIPAWKWEETIRYRARAARGMFHGAMSYGWKGNAMLETDANRRRFMKAWIQETVP